jgi:hypothetical protein
MPLHLLGKNLSEIKKIENAYAMLKAAVGYAGLCRG